MLARVNSAVTRYRDVYLKAKKSLIILTKIIIILHYFVSKPEEFIGDRASPIIVTKGTSFKNEQGACFKLVRSVCSELQYE